MQWHGRKGQWVWSKESKATLDIGVTLRMNQKVAETPFTKPCLLNKWNNRVRKTHEQHRVAFRNPRTTVFRTKGKLWFTYSGNATDHWGICSRNCTTRSFIVWDKHRVCFLKPRWLHGHYMTDTFWQDHYYVCSVSLTKISPCGVWLYSHRLYEILSIEDFRRTQGF